jgi:hypothetical protein
MELSFFLNSFTYALIPCDRSTEPQDRIGDSQAPVGALVDVLREELARGSDDPHSALLEKLSSGELSPEEVDALDVPKILQGACEIVALVLPTAGNGYTSVSCYYNSASLTLNERATALAHRCRLTLLPPRGPGELSGVGTWQLRSQRGGDPRRRFCVPHHRR